MKKAGTKKSDDPVEQSQIDRFWSKVDRSPGHGPNGDCWAWTAGIKTKGGYGGFYLKQVDNTISCHKFAFLISHNFGLYDIPDEIVVRHKCNNPNCVNPDHLCLGTYQHNSQDMIDAKRNRKQDGSHICCKLDWNTVNEIRQKWSTGKYHKQELADEFDISGGTAWKIIKGQLWKDENYKPVEFPSMRTKYSDETVRLVKEDRKNGVSSSEICEKYNMCVSQFYNIINGRQRKEI